MKLNNFKPILSVGYRCLHTSSQIFNKKDVQPKDHDLVVSERIGEIYAIGINRPEKRNCVNLATAKRLVEEFKLFDNDDSLSVAILHGKGGNFCAGFDLSELASSEEINLAEINISSEFSFMGPSRMLTNKPTIAAIDGFAVAGGFELALLCDLRIMEETAVMGVFCRRFGVPLLDGGTVRLPKIVGLSRALDLILTGRPIEAKEALEIGLINRLVGCGTAFGQSIQIAKSISKFPQECLRADRKSAYFSSFEAKSLQDALEFEFDNAKQVINKESIEGAKKFLSGIGKHGEF